MIKKHER